MELTARELEMTADTDVVGYIQRSAIAIKTAADARGDSFYMIPTTQWAERGDYANVYEYKRSMALDEYSDIHKEERGYRPRHGCGDLTLEGVEALISKFFPDPVEIDGRDARLEEAARIEQWCLDNLVLATDDRIL